MDELLERIESAHDDFIADVMAENKSRLPKHKEKFNELVTELNIKIALADPTGMLDLTLPEEVLVYAAIAYKLRFLIDSIEAGLIDP